MLNLLNLWFFSNLKMFLIIKEKVLFIELKKKKIKLQAKKSNHTRQIMLVRKLKILIMLHYYNKVKM